MKIKIMGPGAPQPSRPPCIAGSAGAVVTPLSQTFQIRDPATGNERSPLEKVACYTISIMLQSTHAIYRDIFYGRRKLITFIELWTAIRTNTMNAYTRKKHAEYRLKNVDIQHSQLMLGVLQYYSYHIIILLLWSCGETNPITYLRFYRYILHFATIF